MKNCKNVRIKPKWISRFKQPTDFFFCQTNASLYSVDCSSSISNHLSCQTILGISFTTSFFDLPKKLFIENSFLNIVFKLSLISSLRILLSASIYFEFINFGSLSLTDFLLNRSCASSNTIQLKCFSSFEPAEFSSISKKKFS